MKNQTSSFAQTPNRIAAELLRDNDKILLLPSGVLGCRDSHYEPYLDCARPESAICLSSSHAGRVAVSNGATDLVLLEGRGNRLVFTPASRRRVPIQVQRLLQHLLDNLGDDSSSRCVIEFIEWLYSNRPANLGSVLEYFLANTDPWLIGLPVGTRSERLFGQPAVQPSRDVSNLWYRLVDLEMEPGISLR